MFLELKKLAEDVMGKCGGLLLALKVIGSVFAGKLIEAFRSCLCRSKICGYFRQGSQNAAAQLTQTQF